MERVGGGGGSGVEGGGGGGKGVEGGGGGRGGPGIREGDAGEGGGGGGGVTVCPSLLTAAGADNR